MNPQNSQQALAELQGFQKSYENPNDIIGKQRQQLGYQQAQDTVTGLRGAINNTTKLLKQVAPSVMGRTGSSLVTNAQATRQIANEQAPIAGQINDQSTLLGEESRNLAEINQRAQEAASGIYQGQQDKLSYAQNLYNTLYQREQEAEQARLAELARQEQIRQFNEEQSRLRAASAGGGGSNFNLTPTTPSANMAQRQNGGFNFTDANGQPISAAKYATLTGKNIGDVLYQMGKAGDSYAQRVYNQLKSDPFYNKGNAEYDDKIKKQYNAVFWGA